MFTCKVLYIQRSFAAKFLVDYSQKKNRKDKEAIAMEITSSLRLKDFRAYNNTFSTQTTTTKDAKLAVEYLKNMALLNVLLMPAGYAIPYV